VVVVIGVSSGIGVVMVICFVVEGFYVVVVVWCCDWFDDFVVVY